MSFQSLSGYGMKRFIILVCLVAAQFAHGAHDALPVKTIWVKTDESELGLPLTKVGYDLEKVLVKTNEGKEITLYPDDSIDADSENITYEPSFFNRRVRIAPPTLDLNGKWSVTQTFNNKGEIEEIYQEFDVKIRNIFKKVPSAIGERLEIYEGNYATFKIPGLFPDMKSCIFEVYLKEKYDILAEENSHLKINEPDVCGVRILINETSSGNWYLYVDAQPNETYYSRLDINTLKKSDLEFEPKTLFFQLGEEESIEFSKGYNTITFCQLEDPSGEKLSVQDTCYHKIPFVTKSHAGLWKAHYSLRGSSTAMEAHINVVTFDSPRVNSTVTYVENNLINLMCHVRTSNSEACQFTRPDNLMIRVTPGVGDERYEYYGDGYRKVYDQNGQGIFDCGLTIRSPSKEDFGAWKCIVHDRYGDGRTLGTVLRTENLSKKSNNQSVIALSRRVYVPKGDSFTLKCSADTALNYCWMLSPNGTVYTLSEKRTSNSELTYKGSGFEFGECGAIVEVADNTDMGEWSCRMGTVNGIEVAANVSVTVTDSLLIAEEDTIEISYKKPTILTCRIIPDHNNVINYCRWIRPDGHGIYNKVDNQYVTESTLSSCKLTIQELNVRFDIGSWKCVAGIAGPEMKEATTQIQVEYSLLGFGGFVSVALTIILLVITAITLFVIIVQKRRSRPLDEKAILFK